MADEAEVDTAPTGMQAIDKSAAAHSHETILRKKGQLPSDIQMGVVFP